MTSCGILPLVQRQQNVVLQNSKHKLINLNSRVISSIEVSG